MENFSFLRNVSVTLYGWVLMKYAHMKTYYDLISLEESSAWRDIAFSPHALHIIYNLVAKTSQQYLHNKPNIRWIDVGCGLGRTYSVAKALGCCYTGLDSAQKHIEHCELQYPDGCFICADWLSHYGEYDIITFISVLHHFRNWRAAIEKAFNLLSPGGILIVDHEPTRFYARLFRAYSIWVRKVDPDVIGKVEIHWFGGPSILPSELPDGDVMYHFDYFPILGKLGLRTKSSVLGKFFESYRKIMQNPL